MQIHAVTDQCLMDVRQHGERSCDLTFLTLPTFIYLNVDGPLHASREPEGVACDWVFHIAQEEEVEEEPAHGLYQLVVAFPLLIIH